MDKLTAERQGSNILLIGLGGGAVPLTLSASCPGCTLTAVDISADADGAIVLFDGTALPPAQPISL